MSKEMREQIDRFKDFILKESVSKSMMGLLNEIGTYNPNNVYDGYVVYEDEDESLYEFDTDNFKYEIEIRKPLLSYDFKRTLYSKGMNEIVNFLNDNNFSKERIKNLSIVAFDVIDGADEEWGGNYKTITNDDFFGVINTVIKTILRFKKKYKTDLIYIDPSDNRRKNLYFKFFQNFNEVDKVFFVAEGILISLKT